jgi:hypothetical protein
VIAHKLSVLVHNCETTGLYRVSRADKGSGELDNGLDPADFPRNAEGDDGAAYFGSLERVEDFAQNNHGYGQGFVVRTPTVWLEKNIERGRIDVYEGVEESQKEYAVQYELFGELNEFDRESWSPKGRGR